MCITTTQSGNMTSSHKPLLSLLKYITNFPPYGKIHCCQFYDNTSCFSLQFYHYYALLLFFPLT